MNPSLHYLGIVGVGALDNHALCPAQNARIKAERADEYGPNGAYSHQACIHGQLFDGRGWDTDAAANGGQGGVWYNAGSRSLCMLVGTDDPITPALEATVRSWTNEAYARGMEHPLRPHSFFVATQCPGDNGRALVEKINATPDPDEDDFMAMFTDKDDFGRFLDLHIKKVLDSEGTGVGQPSWGKTEQSILAVTQDNNNKLVEIKTKLGA